MTERPYIIETVITHRRRYNPKYGADRICQCGHTYFRHFDLQDASIYEDADLEDAGCKYCECHDFREVETVVG